MCIHYSPADTPAGIMKNMRVMALDVGDKTIGVAISDALLLTAQPRPTIRRTNLRSDLEMLRNLALENEVEEIVVGQPLHMNGSESRQSQKVGRFVEELRQVLNLRTILWDERLTSVEAGRVLRSSGISIEKRAAAVDKLSAVILLQSYLDSL